MLEMVILMRFLSKFAMLCCLGPLFLVTSMTVRHAHAVVVPDATNAVVPCIPNSAIDPSVHVCVSMHDDARYYRIDTDDDRHVQLSVVDGGVEVLPIGHEKVRVVVLGAPANPVDIESVVYQDNVLQIDQVRDMNDQLTWLVYLYKQRNPRVLTCKNTADCSGNRDL
jgi:hypothetical protein